MVPEEIKNHLSNGKLIFKGYIVDKNGNPLEKTSVVLNEIFLRDKNQLAETKTDAKGFYSITIDSLSDKTIFNLDVLDNKKNLIRASEKMFHSKGEKSVNLAIKDNKNKGISVFNKKKEVLSEYYEKLSSNEKNNKTNIEDVYFIANKTGDKPKDIFHWLRAQELETETKISAEIFYGLFKQGMPTNLKALSSKSATELKSAINKAMEAGNISEESGTKSKEVLNKWNDYIITKTLNKVPKGIETSLGSLLGITLKDKEIQQKVLNAYLNHEGNLQTFWNDLHKITGDKSSSKKIQNVLKLGTLLGNQPDMMDALFNIENKKSDLFHEVATWNNEEWTKLVKELSAKKNKSVVPAFIKGKTEAERIDTYISRITKILEQSFPTQMFFGKLNKQETEVSAFAKTKKDLEIFFTNNSDFDLRTSETVTIKNADDEKYNFDGIEAIDETIHELQSIQRLSAYTTNFENISLLKSAGMDSAYNIVSTPKATFIQDFSSSLGSIEAAQLIYQQAENKFMLTTMIWSMANPNLAFQTATTPDPISDPTLRTMFGTLDACECEHCTSVFSPAAYYTDILNFLYSRTPDVYAELIRRRPDLIHIDLNCENTNTPLPYVDLVNELLENFILTHKTPAVAVPDSYQTTWQAKELAANPEHINYLAYDELKKSVYPNLLPFNLPLEETRIYLDHLGAQRHHLMHVFFAGDSDAAFNDFHINMERLNISLQEGKILSGETTGDGSGNSGLWNFYGFDKETGYKPLSDPADSSKQISGGNWSVKLVSRVDIFLQQTELDYKELISLLLCNAINPITSITPSGVIREINIVSIDGDNSSCELDNLKLTGVTTAHLQKIFRFIRLWRKMGWNMFDLDKAIAAFQLNFGSDINLNKTNLSKIAQTQFFSKQLNLSIESTLVLWNNINTNEYVDYFTDNYPTVDSLYKKLFSNKAVLNPVDPAFSNSITLSGLINDHTATIVSALQISDEDFGYILADVGNSTLNLLNLSKFYRISILAKKLKLTVKDFLSLKNLLGIDPFLTPASAYTFLSRTDAVKTSGLSITQLNYLLRHDYVEESSVASDEAGIGVFLSQLRSSIKAVETASEEEQQNTIIQKFSERFRITATASGLLLQKFVKGITDPAAFVVEDFLADDFSTSDFLKIYSDNTDPLNPVDFEPVFVRNNPLADVLLVAQPNLFDNYIRLEKIAFLINKWKLSDTDLEYILTHNALFLCTDLTKLPIVASAADFKLFETLLNLIKARDIMPIGSPDYFNILINAIVTPNKTNWLDDLEARTTWDRNTLEVLVGDGATLVNAGLLQTNFPAHFVNGDIILKLKNCFNAISKVGLSTELIQGAIAPDMDNIVSNAIKNAAKAKYDEQQWLKIAKPLRDILREKQRVALVAFVVTHSNFNPAINKFERWKNADELYEYLLIDVQMKPINMTSRIKQAICSVQLFIDRVLLNLEHPNSNPAVTALKLEGAQVEEWKEWRKLYRVWEANRKIFLYPENWIEPELRDDKSPFFNDLETELKQNELNNENVEQAFHNYLEKLDEIARLEVVGIYHQLETGLPDEADIDILHVFARTGANPHKYFHRTMEFGEWTSWNKLEIDVDGNHIVPVIFNRRLCLFWLFFTQDSVENASAVVTDPVPRYWKVQVAWSEYKQNKWTAKRLSKSFVISQNSTSSNTLNSIQKGICISTAINNDQLHIGVGGALSTSAEKVFVFNNTNDDPFLSKEFPYAFSSPLVHKSIVGVTWHDQMLKSLVSEDPFEIYVEYDDIDGGVIVSTDMFTILENPKHNVFKLVVPANERGPIYSSFFFQDAKNTFYVTHTAVSVPSLVNPNPGLGDLTVGFFDNYWDLIPEPTVDIEDPFGEIILPVKDIVDIDRHFEGVVAEEVFVGARNVQPQTIEMRGVTVNLHGSEMEMATAFFPEPNITSGSGGEEPGFFLGGKGVKTKYIPDFDFFDDGSVFIHKFKDKDLFTFNTFYHAHVKLFVSELNKHGIKGLLNRNTETQSDTMNFEADYSPSDLVVLPHPTNEIDFTYGSAYSQYNWELFFHVPMLIACRLNNDQRFEEARNWFHYIFNPTNSEGGDKERFWQFKPFYDIAGTEIETLDDLLNNSDTLTKQVEKWMNDPFKPHVIARMRNSAYMKNVVIKYIDNLLDWGDNLFRRDTIEAINEASNLYVMAAKILGERPQQIPPRATHDETTFDDIKDDLDAFSNIRVQIETMISPSTYATSDSSATVSAALGDMFYFCVPRNEFIMKYWDTVADRLFKIRNSMNIEGVVRTMPLFEPPIDPAMLVRAAAAGMDLSSILNDMHATLPHYRFAFMLQKANEFISEVKALGSSLLQALEKRDGESMALLRSVHEQKLLNAITNIKEKNIDDAKAQFESTKQSLKNADLKLQYYSSRVFMNNYEQQQLNSVATGLIFSAIQGGLSTIGGVVSAIPNFKIGAPFSIGATWGGDNLGAMMNAISSYMGIFAAINNAQGSMAGTLGGYTRRMDDWTFQAQAADGEIKQIEKQVISSEIKLIIAEKEAENHNLQIQNSLEADEFMRSKFTNQQLYDWMIGQISTVYFQSYQLAYDLAKKAEQCYQYELGEFGNSNFIQFGYWDSLKKGLLSAEKLQYDLRRMESSYYDKNKRELELTKHISLMLLNPQAILDLRKNGTCNIIIPEAAYDLDFQGHYFRRIKAVSVSIPCIAGPYTSVNATLRLLKHTTRLNTQLLVGAYESSDYSNDLRFRHVTNETHSIATSSAQNDSGMFEFNFRDERFLPFEGCGAFGEWQLELNADETLRLFDYNTISDIIITVRYTAKEDAGPFKTEATTNLKNIIESAIIPTNNSGGLQLSRLFSLKQEFSTEWNKFLNPVVAGNDQILSITIQKQHFPYFIKDRNLKVKTIDIILKTNRTGNYEMIFEGINLDGDVIQSATQTLAEGSVYTGMHSALLDAGTDSANMETVDILQPIKVKFKHESDGDYHSIDKMPEEIGEVYLVVGYQVGV